MATVHDFTREVPEDLARLFAALRPEAALAVRLDAIEDLARWVLDAGGLDRLRKPGPRQLSRLRHLLDVVHAHPDVTRRLSDTMASIVSDTSAVALFADAGIPGDRGIAVETLDRIANRVLPQAPDDDNLELFVSRVFKRQRDCAWIAEAPLELFARLADVLGDIFGPLRAAMADAVSLLCTRVAALGMSAPMRAVAGRRELRSSPFFRLSGAQLDEVPALVEECRRELVIVHEHLESTGVSVDVVYRMDTIRRMLLRIERLVPLLDPARSSSDRVAAARVLFAALTAGRIADTSIRQLGRQNLALLARKIIERVGRTGEHYVTATRRDYMRMLASASGGGALTALTVIGKFLVKWGHLAPFLDGIFASGVYAASFLAMQFLGLTLATKQPSMTAAALAATIRETKGPHQLDELVTLIAKISRSQFAAAIGNVVTVIPVVIGIDLAWTAITGDHFVDTKTATATMASFDPLHSGTIFYATLTGGLLWLSSLCAGWLENWVTYRRLPDALRDHRAGRLVGRQTMRRLGDFVANHSAGIGGNVSLGILLGMTPIIGVVFGVPLDVRHVTLSTGSMTFAGCALGLDAVTASACVGIALIGLLNFGVSFALALAVALQARDVTGRERLGLAVAVARRFVRHPLEFFLPVNTATQPPAHHGGQ